jgi:hypothetical protein
MAKFHEGSIGHRIDKLSMSEKKSVNSIAVPFVLRFSKDERMVFQQTAKRFGPTPWDILT